MTGSIDLNCDDLRGIIAAHFASKAIAIDPARIVFSIEYQPPLLCTGSTLVRASVAIDDGKQSTPLENVS